MGTPIGNLGDISPRAAAALKSADFIAAEDTRVTLKLMNHLQIEKPMFSYFQHNTAEKNGIILRRLLAGETCALVSDAGMPIISDPGEELVALCEKNSISVTVVPGPCACISALVLSGLPAKRFTFEGFLSVNKRHRSEHLKSLATEQRTMIFYEAPHKLLATLKDILETFGDRKIAVSRELTKLYEEIFRGTIGQAVEKYTLVAPRGEFVLVVEGAPKPNFEPISLQEAVKMAKTRLSEGLTVSEAARQVAKETHLRKSDIYRGIFI